MKVIVLDSDCKIYNGRKYIRPGMGDIIDLPDKIAELEIKNNIVKKDPNDGIKLIDNKETECIISISEPSKSINLNAEVTEDAIKDVIGKKIDENTNEENKTSIFSNQDLKRITRVSESKRRGRPKKVNN